MIKILIHGIKDGIHEINLNIPVEEVDDMFPEFFGEIAITGKLRKLGNRFSIIGEAKCQAKLICDLSLKEYNQFIVADITASFYANDDLFFLKNDDNHPSDLETIIREDELYLDLSEEVREQLAVRLPMRRIAPDMMDVEFNEIYPDYSEDKVKKDIENGISPDERWAPPKNLKLN